MKWLLIVAMLFCSGCMATQQEVMDLHNVVNQIVPAVRDIVSTSSDDTKDTIEVILGQVEVINKAVATAETPIEAIKAGVAATSPVNPYAVPILAGITILEALGIFTEKKKVTKLTKGISRVTGEAEPDMAKKIHDTIKIYTG